MVSAVAVWIGLATGCSSPAVQYLLHRLWPDRTPTQGEVRIAAPGLRAPVEVVFDRFAIPHIRAQDASDLSFGLGYMHARDRRFQLESMRLLAAGRARELVGDQDSSGVIERLDGFSRLIGYHQDADHLLAEASPQELAVLDAYAAGINLATANEPLPLEFRLLDSEPGAWTPRDSFLVLAMMSFALSKNWEHELGRLELVWHQLRTGSTIERALEIWKPRLDLSPHLFGEAPQRDPFADIPPIAPELAAFLRSQAKAGPHAERWRGGASRLARGPAPWLAFQRGGSASNNWAMSGAWTGTGKGALGSDPHMPHSLPSLGYLAHLECDGCEGGSFQVIGGGFLGLPGLAFGTNGAVAWGATSNWADVADLYVERLVADGSEYYETPDGPERFGVREERFRIRRAGGSFREELRTVRSTRHGVVINDIVDRIPADFPLVALHRHGLRGHPVAGLLALYRAGDVREARAALADLVAFSGHWALADTAGNVAYVPSVRLPRRTRHLGTFPVPGWTDSYEWSGFVPVDQLPWIANPPRGLVASANNQVMSPTAFSIPMNLEGDVVNRYLRIMNLLSAGPAGGSVVERTRAMHLDGVDAGIAPLLTRYREPLARLGTDADPVVARAARALAVWDGDHVPEGFEPTLWNTLVALLVERVLEDEMSAETLEFVLEYFNIEPFVSGILLDFSNPAWDDRRTADREAAEPTIEQVFREAVAVLVERYGRRPEDWTWQRAAPFILRHPFGGQKLLASYLNRGPLPTRGSGNTINKHQFVRIRYPEFRVAYGPVLRINVDLNDLTASRMSLPGGQSGRPSSRHYDDLLPLYLTGDGASMELDFERVASAAVGRLLLEPASTGE